MHDWGLRMFTGPLKLSICLKLSGENREIDMHKQTCFNELKHQNADCKLENIDAIPRQSPNSIPNTEHKTFFGKETQIPKRATFVYEPDLTFPCFRHHINHVFKVQIDKKYLTLANPKVENTHIWGTDIYTDDSDIVASFTRIKRWVHRFRKIWIAISKLDCRKARWCFLENFESGKIKCNKTL
ncbi:hypothetical protein ROZALSC1DRAFT_22254 [Rozella allomycis CSF55]|uniref:Uncharacterized protein n=1 Tax=Rozella allomycis (strain CSF55) TaxID=988480 RepID=A0A4P9YK49_ROZAC|nr:hypothetical protein ROZALSC1DRAFT_22254 [Rozella allomycis CSF55]